jgi:hypothetical protein
MNREPFEIRAIHDIMSGPRSLSVAGFKGDSIAMPMTFESTSGGRERQPTVSGRDGRDFLQAALNCAWEMGLRPTGFEHTAETIKATDRHLQDMRAIAFTKLNVEKPTP